MLAWCFKFVPIFTSYAERHAEIVLVRPYKCEPECEWIRDLERRGSAVFIFMHHLSGNPGIVWSLQGFYWALFCLSERYPVPEFALGLRCTLTRGNNEIETGILSSGTIFDLIMMFCSRIDQVFFACTTMLPILIHRVAGGLVKISLRREYVPSQSI